MTLSNANKGFSIIEMLIAVSVFSLFAGGFLLAYLHGQQSSVFSGQRIRAVYLAEEGLEAARNMRDQSFENLTDGSHGLSIESSRWVLLESPDVTDDFFTRQVDILTLDPYRKKITSTVTWPQTSFYNAKVELVTYLTDWKR